MKAKSFRVTKYRNIQDSGEVTLDSDLTCLVGKNQSGKTSILRALHKFNPRDPSPYDMRREWPRGERRSKDSKQIVCTVKFALSGDERDKLKELTEVAVPDTPVVVTKNYEGEIEITFDGENPFPESLHPNDVDAAVQKLPVCPEDVSEEFATEAKAFCSEATRLAREGRFTQLGALWKQVQPKLQALVGQMGNPQQGTANTYVGQLGSGMTQVSSTLASSKNVRTMAHEQIVTWIPTFIYMSDYDEFHGTAILNQVKERRDSKKPTQEDLTFQMILHLAGLDLDNLIAQGSTKDGETVRERQYDLDDAGRTLTKDLAGRWGQHPYEVQFRADNQTFFTEITQPDRDIGLIPLEEQSKGFQWFFSFDLRFMHDSGGSFENCVLLLDEPGLHLHPGAQKDLLKRLDAYAQNNTLLYTTHLPFLIDLREPSRIRAMSEADGGFATVTDDLSKSGKDERLTLQAALGMQLDQHYLVGARNLVVEGVHDYWLLTELSNLFVRSERSGLPQDVVVSAAGGASEGVYLATYMIGQGLDVVALFDGDEAGKSALDKLTKQWLLKYKEAHCQALCLDDACGSKTPMTVEDLFSEEEYLSAFQASHAKKPGAADVVLTSQNPLLEKRVEAAALEQGVQYNKGSVAKVLATRIRRMKTIKDLNQETLKKAEKLFERLGELLPEEA